jgi:hypothetical protein
MVSMEVLERLRRLEGVVQALGGLPEESDVTEDETNRRRADGNRKPQSQPHLTSIEDGADQEFGRLVIDDTRSRYVSNKILASLGDKVYEPWSTLSYHYSYSCSRLKRCETSFISPPLAMKALHLNG